MQERSELVMIPFINNQQNTYANLVQLRWCEHTTVNQIYVIKLITMSFLILIYPTFLKY